MPKCVYKPKGMYSNRSDSVVYWCPGCNERHSANIQKSDGIETPSWEWDGNTENPTIHPSVDYTGCCHHFVKCGRIEYLDGCAHALAGKTVSMMEVDEDGYAIDDTRSRGESAK